MKYTHHNYDLNKRLTRNKWTLLSVIHTKSAVKIFIDGAIHFSLDENFYDSNNTDVMPFYSMKCVYPEQAETSYHYFIMLIIKYS